VKKCISQVSFEFNLPTHDLYHLFDSLVTTLYEDDEQLNVRCLTTTADKHETHLVTAIQARAISAFFMSVHEIAALLGYLRAWVFTASGKLSVSDKDGMIKAEIKKSFRILQSQIPSALQEFQNEAIRNLEIPWLRPLESLAAWLHSCTKALISLTRVAMVALTEDIASMAKKIEMILPQYASICNDDVYHAKLVRKTLLIHPSSTKLQPLMVSLFKSLSAATKTHASWELTPDLDLDPELSENIQFARDMFDNAKKTLVVITAIVVVEGSKSEQQSLDANALLGDDTKKAMLPLALVKLLEPLATKSIRKRTVSAAFG
jgi:hypothetical protein